MTSEFRVIIFDRPNGLTYINEYHIRKVSMIPAGLRSMRAFACLAGRQLVMPPSEIPIGNGFENRAPCPDCARWCMKVREDPLAMIDEEANLGQLAYNYSYASGYYEESTYANYEYGAINSSGYYFYPYYGRQVSGYSYIYGGHYFTRYRSYTGYYGVTTGYGYKSNYGYYSRLTSYDYNNLTYQVNEFQSDDHYQLNYVNSYNADEGSQYAKSDFSYYDYNNGLKYVYYVVTYYSPVYGQSDNSGIYSGSFNSTHYIYGAYYGYY